MKIKEAEAIYTGGGIWLFYGQLEDSNWFMADEHGAARILDTDPLFDLDVSTYEEWQLEHLVKDLSGDERIEFCKELMQWLETHREYGMSDTELEMYRKRFGIEPDRLEMLAGRLDQVIRDIEPYDYEGSADEALERLRDNPIGVIEYLVGMLEEMA